MPLKVQKEKFMLDEQVVKDSVINPRLVKKRPENSLILPRVSSQRIVPITIKEYQDTDL